MNIFYLARDPEKAAEMLCDKHLVKMILETAQLLSSAHHVLESPRARVMYKLTHKNHPCAKWVRDSFANYQWLYIYFLALSREYTLRYERIHKTSLLYPLFAEAPARIPNKQFTSPPQCMPDEYKHSNTVTAYRRYYVEGKKHVAKRWTNRAKPKWHN